jgi:hypothetical protein
VSLASPPFSSRSELTRQTELLLDRLVLVCSRVIIRHCNEYNAASLACEANFYQATTLKLSIFDYIISCMETMLESGLLDDMDDDTLSDLAKAIGEQQGKKLSVSRSQILVKKAMETHKEWLALQDIPTPRVRQPWKWKPRSPALSPVDTITPTRRRGRATPSPLTSPELQAVRSTSAVDDIFTMDDDPSSPSAASGSTTPKISRPVTPLDLTAGSQRGAGAGPVWRSTAVEAQK